MQASVKKMLADSAKEEYKVKPGECILRYYNMTSEEYIDKFNYTLIITLSEQPPNEKNFCEAFAYDLRDLLAQGFLKMDQSIQFIPVPVSQKRWQYLEKTIKNLKTYYDVEGILKYPLTKQEVILLFKNIRNQPAICSSSTGCSSVDLESCKHLTKLYDTSKVDRFAGVKQNKEKPIVIPPAVKSEIAKEESNDINTVISLTEEELKAINLLTPKAEQTLKSQQTRIYIDTLLKSGKQVQQVAGILIYETIVAFLKSAT